MRIGLSVALIAVGALFGAVTLRTAVADPPKCQTVCSPLDVKVQNDQLKVTVTNQPTTWKNECVVVHSKTDNGYDFDVSAHSGRLSALVNIGGGTNSANKAVACFSTPN
jgi:hypothetical protein